MLLRAIKGASQTADLRIYTQTPPDRTASTAFKKAVTNWVLFQSAHTLCQPRRGKADIQANEMVYGAVQDCQCNGIGEVIDVVAFEALRTSWICRSD